MAQRPYYYLIAGLPEIALEQTKAPFTVQEFLVELEERLAPDDLGSVRLLLLPYEHDLVIGLLRRDAATPHPWGRYEAEALADQLKEPGPLPDYFYRFQEAYRRETPIWPGLSWENQLTWLYYDYALDQAEGFLYDWLRFERDLRNFLVASNCRAYGLPLSGQLIGDDGFTTALAHSHAGDFGLANDHPFVDRLLQALEYDDPLRREQAIDYLKWQFIDDANTFHYFTIEVVLGFLLKLIMLERWLGLDNQAGREAIEQAIRRREGAAIPLMQKRD